VRTCRQHQVLLVPPSGDFGTSRFNGTTFYETRRRFEMRVFAREA